MDNMIITGLDIGNGYVKGAAKIGNGEKTQIDIPSCVAMTTNMHDVKVNNADIESEIKDIYNRADISFVSQTIDDTRRVLFGKRALHSKLTPIEFDVNSPESKANEPLSYMLILGCLACKTLQEYWNTNKELPKDVYHINARVALALPVNQYKAYRKVYADRLTSGVHTVTIHNFEQPIQIQIEIKDVQVLAEGASAQYAIGFLGKPLMDAIVMDLKKHTNLDVTSDDILAAKNTVGVDIGEGTVNFPVFTGGKFNPDASITFNKGYGSALSDALERLQNQGLAFDSRKALAEFLNEKPNALTQKRYNKVISIIQDSKNAFAAEVGIQFSKILKQTGSFLELVYVYGGGAGAIKDELYPILLKEASRFGGEDTTYPILYLDSTYSRVLNREGLYLVADLIYKNNKM